MPELSRFFGIVIAMHYNDHPPPHFHARYGEQKATIEIESLTVLQGQLAPTVRALVVEWAAAHRQELRANWEHARKQEPLVRISSLE
jgi:hypothetical protein